MYHIQKSTLCALLAFMLSLGGSWATPAQADETAGDTTAVSSDEAAEDTTAAQADEAAESQAPRSSAIDMLQESIIVTGTKKAGGQDIQDAPVSMIAFGENQLDAFNVQNISDLSYRIPNVALDEVGTVKGTANFTIRGLGVNSSIPSIDPAVGTFVDGIYYGTNFGVVMDTFDLAGFEALRGPQGVLFGRNVTGGAILLNTTDPTDELTIRAKAGADSGFRGTGINYTQQFLVSGPLVENTLSGKFAVYHNDDKGWFENQVPGAKPTDPIRKEDFGKSRTTILRGALKWTPDLDTTLVVKYEDGDQKGEGPAAQTHRNAKGVGGGKVVNFERDTHDFSIDATGFGKVEWTGVSAKLEKDVSFGDGTITNIFGWRDFEQRTYGDIDATPQYIFHAGADMNQEQYSNELRYNGTFFEDRLDLTTGVFYFTQDILYQENRDIAGGKITQSGGGIIDQKTLGVFASADFLLTDALTLQAGLRYSDETKDGAVTNIAKNVNNPCVVDGAFVRPLPDGTISTRRCVPDLQKKFETDNWSPKLGLGYEHNDILRFYGHWARSFRAGGFNLRNTNAKKTQDTFQDERIDSFEIGFKSEPLAGATLNGAVFLNFMKDMQRELNLPDPNAGVAQTIINTADAEILGFELDASFPVTEELMLIGGVGYLDAEYKKVFYDLTGDGVVDAKDLALDIPRLAPFSGNIGFIYSRSVSNIGLATLNFTYSYRDKSAFTDNNLGVLHQANRVDADFTLDFFNSGASVSVYGKNLTNDVQIGGDTILPPAVAGVPTGGTFSPLAVGRRIGLELEWEF